MMPIQIVTSNCIDVIVDENEQIIYPQLKDINGTQRRMIYWQCVIVFFATSTRFNPDCRHILYTNDENDLIDKGVDLKKMLQSWGVEIRYLPFASFCPPKGYSDTFKNAFYKLDVIKALGEEEADNFQILLDSDCAWVGSARHIARQFQSEKGVILYDTYSINYPDKPATTKDYLTKVEVGKLYQAIDDTFSIQEPCVFGGEIIAGNTSDMKLVADRLTQSFEHILTKYTRESALPRFSNKRNIFSGMEYWSSMIYNTLPHQDATPFVRRIWTAFRNTEIRESDWSLIIWHMPAEKDKGFPLLYKQVIRENTTFWKLSGKPLQKLIGEYLGISGSILNLKRLSIYLQKAKIELKKKLKMN